MCLDLNWLGPDWFANQTTYYVTNPMTDHVSNQ